MRMWAIDHRIPCDRHLLGWHVELHMAAGCLLRNKNIHGYLVKGLLFPTFIKLDHLLIAKEMERRGFKHNSPLPEFEVKKEYIDWLPTHEIRKGNLEELFRRCPVCRERIESFK